MGNSGGVGNLGGVSNLGGVGNFGAEGNIVFEHLPMEQTFVYRPSR